MQELFSLDGKVALVTGASRGIGLMIARGLAASGARVWLLARREEALAAAAAELASSGWPVRWIAADISLHEEITRVAALFADEEPRLHVLVNNAGAVWNARLDDFPVEGWDKVLSLNLRSPFFLVQRLLPLLRAAAQPGDPARIINIASTDAMHVPLTDTFSYTAAKAGLLMLTRMLAARLGADGISVNAIAPGPFYTKMTAETFAKRGDEFLAHIPLGRFGTPEDIAGAAVFLAARASAYVSGAVLPVDGGWVGGL